MSDDSGSPPLESRNKSLSANNIDELVSVEDDDESFASYSFPGRSSQTPEEGDEDVELAQHKTSLTQEAIQRIQSRGLQQSTNKSPKDFTFFKVIGDGAFSTVYLAQEVATRKPYAIKVLTKDQINRENKVESVVREKNIMASLTYAFGGHPFVVSLYCTFQDHERLYFAMSYAPRGELLAALNRVGCFDLPTTRFLSAEILEGLSFLHTSGVVHRDIKPENILFGETGHIIITDFGSAQIIANAGIASAAPVLVREDGEDPMESARRATFVGTAQYVSPEMLSRGPVGPACDFWAFGAVIYQMLSGQAPFRAINDYQMMRKIQKLEYSFPNGFPETPRDLVEKLLVSDPVKRLGAWERGGATEIKEHAFFEGVDFATLHEQKAPEIHPYLPASDGEPEFYSDFEPGFDDKAMTRLLGLFSMKEGTTRTTKISVILKDFGPVVHYDIDNELKKMEENGGGGASKNGTTNSSPRDIGVVPGINDFPQPKASIASENLPKTPETVEQRAAREAAVRAARLEKQRKEHAYHRFVDDNVIFKSGLIDKKKGLFARRRMFLLTEGPHLYYVDPVGMELKGEIPWSHGLRTEAKNFRTFFVHTPERTYYLFDPERRAVDWCRAIDEVKLRYFKPGTAPPPVPESVNGKKLKKEKVKSPPKPKKSKAKK